MTVTQEKALEQREREGPVEHKKQKKPSTILYRRYDATCIKR